MEDLTFGEQVKIILGRKGMTIKELAEIIEERTGKKMSRQNMTQRLGRDNFQEQDMRMIADILGCPFHLSILSRETAAVKAAEGTVPAEREWKRAERKHQHKPDEYEQAVLPIFEMQEPEEVLDEEDAEDIEAPVGDREASVVDAEEVDMTIGELYEIHEELTELEDNAEAGEPVEAIKEELEKPAEKVQEKKEKFRTGGIFLRKKGNTLPEEEKEPVVQEKSESVKQEAKSIELTPDPDDFEPVIKHEDAEEDRELGDVNPYTGREFQTNSVRMHPNRIGYVQVYDRGTHKWTDMTEWAFPGYQERKKALLGKEYEPPIYLD